MFRELRTSISLFLILLLATGFIYPMLTLKIGQVVFPFEANGSLIENNGAVMGSTLIGQNFSSPDYFHARPSSAGNGYDAAASSGSNFGPSNADFLKAVSDRIAALKAIDSTTPIPVDLVTGSGSGLDPHISVAAARFQASHIAEMRHMDVVKVDELIAHYTTSRTWSFLGEERVNVLELNQALDQLAPITK